MRFSEEKKEIVAYLQLFNILSGYQREIMSFLQLFMDEAFRGRVDKIYCIAAVHLRHDGYKNIYDDLRSLPNSLTIASISVMLKRSLLITRS